MAKHNKNKKDNVSFSSVVIAFILLGVVLNYLSPVLIVVLIIVAVVVSICVVIKEKARMESIDSSKKSPASHSKNDDSTKSTVFTEIYSDGNLVTSFSVPVEKKLRSDINSTTLNQAIQNDIRIMNESLKLINESKNIETVIGRYNDLIIVLERLAGYEENPAVSFPHELPSATLLKIQDEQAKILNTAIQRAYDDMLHKCASLKTEKGRKNRHMRFFDELANLLDKFPPETQDFIVEFTKKNIDDPLTDLEGL